MSKIIDRIQSAIAPYKQSILIFLFLLILGYIGYFVYKKKGLLMSKEEKKFKDVANANKHIDIVEFYFFHADWCPHCKNAQPEWDKFKAEYNNKKMGNLKILCSDKDCSETSQAQANKSEFGVESYPTIKVFIDKDMENPIEYDAKITSDRLKMFLDEISDATI